MILVRTGGVFGLLIALLVAALFFFVVRPAIDDTTERAFQTADRALDQAATQTQQIAQAMKPSGDQLSHAAFAEAVAAIRSKLGPDAELLGVAVTPAGGNVKYRTGDHAAGFEWGTGHQGLDPVEVTLIGPGKLSDNVFPIAKLRPDATARLAAAVKADAGPGFAFAAMSLGLDPATGEVQWTVSGERRGRQLTYQASAGATGVHKVG
jgi:hypothetical protein